MTNPLVEQPKDSTKSFSGVPILESVDETKKAIENGDWAAGVLGAAGAGLDALTMAMDPFGSILAAGVGWLIEHVGPVSEALDSLTGDADEIKAHSETWKNISGELAAIGTDMTNLVRNDTAAWTGAAGDAYRARSEDTATLLAAAKSAADGAADGIGTAGEVVGAVRTLVRDIIAELVGHLISWALQVVATLGIGATWVVPQVVAEVAKVASKIADTTTKLVKALKALAPMLKKLGSSFADTSKALKNIKANGSTAPPPPKSPPPPKQGDGPASTSPSGASGPAPTPSGGQGPAPTTSSGSDGPSSTGGPGGPGSSGGPSTPRGGPSSGPPPGPTPRSPGPASTSSQGANPKPGGGGQKSDGNGGCDGKGGDPVDAVSGQMITNGVDVDLPALLPLVLQRAYASDYRGGRLHGPGWSSTLDQRLEIDQHSVRYFGDDAQVLHYDRPDELGARRMPEDGARWPLTWDRDTDTYQVEDPESGWVRHFGPNPSDQRGRPITAVTDRNDNRIAYERDANGVPTQVVHSGGYRITVDTVEGHDGPRVTALRLGADNTALVEYRYDQHGRLTGIIESTLPPYRYEYDDADRITAWVDREGYRYSYTYRADGRVVRGEGRDGYLSADFDYDLVNRSTAVTDSLGQTTVFHYDEHHHLTKVVDPLGNVELTEYDRFHRLLSRTDELGNTIRFTLGWDGDIARVDRPDGTTATFTYNDLRQPVEIVEPNGARWLYSYDERGNLLALTDPSGAVTTYTVGERGEPRTITDALGNTTTVATNAAGLPVSVTDPSGATETYVLDARGRLVETTNPIGAVTRIEWGKADVPARYIYSDGTTETATSDGNGDIIATTDRNGSTTRYEVGPFHTVVARVDPDGTRHVFAHDTELRITEVTNPQQLVWRYTYDRAGALSGEQDFNGSTVSYEHDAAGRLVGIASGTGESIAIRRDALGRSVEQRTGDGQVSTLTYDEVGQVVNATTPDAELSFTRDPVGRVLAETANGRTLSSTYDALGRRTSRTTPTGHRSVWQYDSVGQPTALTTGDRRITFGHDPTGREVHRWLSTDTALTSAWDGSGRLSSRQLVGMEGPAGGRVSRSRFGRSWTYRADGAPRSMSDSFEGNRRFDLDPLGRPTAVHAQSWNESYAYDESGNLAFAVDSRAADSPAAGPRSTTGTLVRRAGRTHHDYDAQGRLVRTVRHTLSGAQQVWTYRYDTRNRLTEAVTPDGQRWRYQYDPLGRRIAKRRLAPDGGIAEEVRFHWDGEVLAEQEHVDNGTSLVTTTTWDHEPDTWTPVSQDSRTAAANAPQQVIDRRFHAIVTDLVGTPTELVTPDGRVEWRQRASLWGEEHGPAGLNGVECLLRFPGQYHDRETGLNYNYHRYYDPTTGSYTTPDPLGLDAGPNNHAFVDNPLVLFDPLGLITRARYQYMDRPGWNNYTLSDRNGNVYYSGMFGPRMTEARTRARHERNGNRFDPANGDTMTVRNGTRTYGESRALEQVLANQHNTFIGRQGNNQRGNREQPLAGRKRAEYVEYLNRKRNGLGCP